MLETALTASTVLIAAGSAVLIRTGLDKVMQPAHAERMLVAIGTPAPVAIAVSRLAAALELFAGTGLAFAPSSALVAATVFVLSSTFALLGAVALSRGLSVPCACLGTSYGHMKLGIPQLAALPAWWMIAMVALGTAPDVSEATHAARWLGIFALLGAWYGADALGMIRLMRANRLGGLSIRNFAAVGHQHLDGTNVTPRSRRRVGGSLMVHCIHSLDPI